jgi:hypothetical protein
VRHCNTAVERLHLSRQKMGGRFDTGVCCNSTEAIMHECSARLLHLPNHRAATECLSLLRR